MKSFDKMTREQLAKLIVMDQVVRGVTHINNAAYQVKIRLQGGYGIKPMTKSELVRVAQNTFTN